VLNPAPVGLAAGEPRTLGKAVEFIGVVVLFLELGLVPHGIGHGAVKGLEVVALAELRLTEGVANLDLALHVVDDHVHVGHGPGAGLVFLPVELDWGGVLLPGRAQLFVVDEAALYEQAGGAATGIIDVHSGCGIHDAGHDETDLCRCVELACALAAALGKFSDEVFIASPDDVRLYVGEPESLGADGLDEIAQPGVINVALAVGGGVEINAVNDALEQRVGVGDGPEVGGKLLADLVRERADDGPYGIVWILRLQRQGKADEFLVVLHQLERLGSRADFLGDAVDLVIEHIAQALGEDEREDEFLVFRRILGSPDGTGGIPDPGFERFAVQIIRGHRAISPSIFVRG